MLYGLFPQTPIMSDMDWPIHDDPRHPEKRKRDPADHGAIRIGYISQGGKVAVVPEAHPKQNCLEGWYELVDGGFVCGRYGTLDMNHPRVKQAPHAPYLDQALPYEYGYNITNGTPLYKSVPSREDRVRLEPWLHPKPKPKPQVQAVNSMDAGVTTTAVSVALSQANANPADPLGVLDAEDAGTPWYLRSYDGGKPQITLDELKEDGGPISRRMVKGFYLALDKEVDTGPRKEVKWWRNTAGFLAPYERIFVAKPLTDFHGVWLGQEPPQEDVDSQTATSTVDAGYTPTPRPGKKIDFPVAFILWGHSHKYTLSDDRKKATATDGIRRFAAVQLTGQDATVAGHHYIETVDGWWMRESEGTVARTTTPPKDLLPNEKWIDVNLKTQTLVAFEGDKPVYATLVSTGRMNDDDKEKDHRTKPGTFRIREKHVAATMDGDVASDGPYSIEDVPWIMYFNASIALHGAFWHSNFGHVQSHGCVNLSPMDAHALFGWTEPQLPKGWHGVEATADKPGTRVIVHDPPESHPKWADQ
jgi:L,D-transpeptidase catalytic domain